MWQYETLDHGRSRGTSFIHLGFVVAEIYGFKIVTFIMKHAVYSVAHSEQTHKPVGTAAGCDKRHLSVKIMNPYNNFQ